MTSTGLWLASSSAHIPARAVDRSRVVCLVRWIGDAVRSAWLFRWLTAEPEPTVIVIDLRQTVSVAPIITGIELLARLLGAASHRSRIITVLEAALRHMATVPVRAASLALAGAVLTHLSLTLTVGSPTRSGVIVHVIILGLAVLGTRITLTWTELVETWVVQQLIACFEPPSAGAREEKN